MDVSTVSTNDAIGLDNSMETDLEALVKKARQIMDKEGVYSSDALFNLMYKESKKHYATVRRAIHIAKTR